MSTIIEDVRHPMKAPAHPGALVRDTLAEFGLSVAAGAEGLGVTRQQLHNVCAGKSAISPEMAVRLEIAFGGKAEMWLRMQAAYDLAVVRASAAELSVRAFRPAAA